MVFPLPMMDEQLQPGEMVLATCGRLYATDRRIIYEDSGADPHGAGGSEVTFPALPYAWIASVRLVTRIRVTTVVLGVVVAVLAMVSDPIAPLQRIAVALGVIAIVMGVLSKSRSLEVRSRAGQGPVVHRWSLGDGTGDAARTLLRTVRSGIANPVSLVTPTPSSPTPSATAAGDSARIFQAPRSVLVVPADRPQQLREALSWGHDVLCLDERLADPHRRELARDLLWAEVVAAAGARAPVWARIDHEGVEGGLMAAVWPGLSAVVARTDSPEAVQSLDAALGALEAGRQIPNRVGIVAVMESGAALWSAREIALASPRVMAVALGMSDLRDGAPGREEAHSHKGSRPSPEGLRPVSSREHVWGRAALGTSAAGVPLLGFLNMVDGAEPPGEPGVDAAALEAVARDAFRAGFSGAFSAGLEGVLACNAGFVGLSLATDAPTVAIAEALDGCSQAAEGPMLPALVDEWARATPTEAVDVPMLPAPVDESVVAVPPEAVEGPATDRRQEEDPRV